MPGKRNVSRMPPVSKSINPVVPGWSFARMILRLRATMRMQRAMNHSSRCDELMTEHRVPEALEECSAATRLLPDFPELRFWHAVTLASIGRESDAAPIFRDLFRAEPFWADLLRRLPASGLFPADPALMERMQALAPRSQKR